MGDVTGEIETTDDGVLVIRRIHVAYRLRAPEAARDKVERVHGFHARKCPIYRSLEASIAMTTSLDLIPTDD